MAATLIVDVDELEQSIAAYSTHASEYATWAATLPMNRHLDTFCATLPPVARILDAGCGPGRDLAEFVARGYHADGVDLTREFVTAARAAGHRVYLADLRNLPLTGASYDGIWSCASLVHLDPHGTAQALAEFRRVIKPAGTLFVSVKAGNDTGGWEQTLHGRRWFHRWSPTAAQAGVRDAGFQIDDIVTEGAGTRTWITIRATAT